MEKAPGDGADFVKGRQGLFGPFDVDDTGSDEELQMAVDLLG